MNLKTESAVFFLFTGWVVMGLTGGDDSGGSGSSAKGKPKKYEAVAIPDSAGALPLADRSDYYSRDLFAPPSDTAPLPPLELVMPPLEALPALAPPSAYGPGASMAHLLATPLTITPVPGLFSSTDEDDQPPPEDGGPLDPRDLSADQRAARIAAFKRLHDWGVIDGSLRFGQIRNKGRYDLARSNEDIQFVEVDPDTGVERFPGQPAIPIARDRVTEYGLAETPENFVELGQREFKLPLGPGDAEKAARFADRCVELRNDTDRALKVAEKMYRALTEANASDLEGFLGLARCYELGFRFDDAFSLYRSLTEGRFSTEPAAWARLGELMAQFRLFDRAEESFREGLRARRTDWEANWRFGRFLLDRGRADEAIEVLEQAALRQPTGVEWARTRAGIRADLGACLLHLGRVQESHDAFQGVVSSDPSDDRGLAGVYSAALFLEDAESPDLSTVGQDVAEASFDLLLALGLQAIDQQEWSLALRSLERAVRTDPFRAWQAWRALSWLAEITGHPEEAYSYIERAYLAEPTDPWILYQLARLLTQQGDVPGAMSAYREALDRNLNFADALIGLAHLSQLTGEFEAAERYYHRALSIDPGRPVVHSLRGFNHFSLGNTDLAGQSFQEARELDEQLWSAKNGLAWWFYATGRSGEAINQFGYVINDAPNGSDHRQYADDQVKRIQGHELKEVWTDRFDRVGSIQNGWSLDEKDGVISNLKDGQVWLEGVLDKNGRGRVYQQLPAERFLAVEATVTIHDLRDLNGGLFVSKEQPGRADEVRVTSKVALRRDKGGKVQVTFFRKGSSEEEVIDLPDHSWRDGEARRVRIETNADASHTRVSVYIDGLPVLQDLEIQSFGRSQNPVRFGVFVEGNQGRTARISVDDVNVIRIK